MDRVMHQGMNRASNLAGGKKVKAEAAKAVVSMSSNFYRRFAKDRKTFVNLHCEDFLQHLQEPKPGVLTGDFLPCVPLSGWRGVSKVEMDRALACGPSKDPVVHRGLFIKQSLVPPFPTKAPTTIITLLAVPPAARYTPLERDVLDLVQSMLRLHYSGHHTSAILDVLQHLAETLETPLVDAQKEVHKTECRAIVLQSMLKKRKFGETEMAKFMIAVGNWVEVDKSQVESALDSLRKRDKLTEEQTARARSLLMAEIREGKSEVVLLIMLQRVVLRVTKLEVADAK